ncbi:hypothetical protein HYX17_03795 [Candidatus Woesearchaeota archaeon]|nr:hypothetical protein [Candidatus Woesearchaeota archaeon]
MVEKKQTQKEEGLLEFNYGIVKKDKKFLFLLFAGLFMVYSFLFGLWKIPVVNFGINRLSAVGIWDYLFLFGTSALISIFVVLWRHERKSQVQSLATVGIAGGGFAGLLAGICPVCQSIGLVAFGTTFLNIPTTFLTPYLGILKTLSIGLLILAVYLKADSVYTKTCKTCLISPKKKEDDKKESLLFRNNYVLGGIVITAVLLFFNQLMIPQAFASVSAGGEIVNLGNFEYGSKITLKPMPLAVGEQPKIAGYKSIVKPLPTISELSIVSSTGDAVQDLLNNIVPTGNPWYGEQAGVSFDDPIAAQNRWAIYRSLQLTSAEQERWNRIANSFTCDYCCGSPQNPTIITRCGCAHSAAAQGMAKWFVKYYGDSYSDEEIYGEMARWYALWYPKGTIERIILEAQ